MRWAALALALSVAGPADAACHRYSTWRYPWPQPRCGGVYARATIQKATYEALKPPAPPIDAPLPPPAPAPDPEVPVIVIPPLTPIPPSDPDDPLQRNLAVKVLKGLISDPSQRPNATGGL